MSHAKRCLRPLNAPSLLRLSTGTDIHTGIYTGIFGPYRYDTGIPYRFKWEKKNLPEQGLREGHLLKLETLEREKEGGKSKSQCVCLCVWWYVLM